QTAFGAVGEQVRPVARQQAPDIAHLGGVHHRQDRQQCVRAEGGRKNVAGEQAVGTDGIGGEVFKGQHVAVGAADVGAIADYIGGVETPLVKDRRVPRGQRGEGGVGSFEDGAIGRLRDEGDRWRHVSGVHDKGFDAVVGIQREEVFVSESDGGGAPDAGVVRVLGKEYFLVAESRAGGEVGDVVYAHVVAGRINRHAGQEFLSLIDADPAQGARHQGGGKDFRYGAGFGREIELDQVKGVVGGFCPKRIRARAKGQAQLRKSRGHAADRNHRRRNFRQEIHSG